MNYFAKKIFVVFILIFIVSCTTTTVTVKSNPPGATVVFEKSGVSLVTDRKIELEFPSEQKLVYENLIFEKQGYRIKKQIQLIEKGKHTDIHVNLEKLDTILDISSPISPISLEFVLKKQSNQGQQKQLTEYIDESDNVNAKAWQYQLPEGWPLKFTTPIRLECTKEEAAALVKWVNLKVDEFSGYVPSGRYSQLMVSQNNPSGMPLSLKGNYKNSLSIPLKPIVTTLQVITTPSGAIVEDVSSGGFGYIGETPVIRNFNWEDVLQWSEKKHSNTSSDRKRRRLHNRSLYLDLRISKLGYEETYLRRLRLPIGEDRSFHKNLNRMITQINFASDPAGTHVYVSRQKDKEIYVKATGEFITEHVSYRKHLGTTPFTLNVDPNDPLQHGETIVYKKSGYEESKIQFADGNASYFEVMTPKKVMER